MTGAECRTHPGRCCNTRPRAQLPHDENKSVPFSINHRDPLGDVLIYPNSPRFIFFFKWPGCEPPRSIPFDPGTLAGKGL